MRDRCEPAARAGSNDSDPYPAAIRHQLLPRKTIGLSLRHARLVVVPAAGCGADASDAGFELELPLAPLCHDKFVQLDVQVQRLRAAGSTHRPRARLQNEPPQLGKVATP